MISISDAGLKTKVFVESKNLIKTPENIFQSANINAGKQWI